jgi:hypothetical protein
MESVGALLCCGARAQPRRAASSICAVPNTRTIAAIVAVSFAGSVTVGCRGHLISIAAGVSGRWTNSIASRSDCVTEPTARNRSEPLDGELSTGLRFPTRPSFTQMQIFCPSVGRMPSNLANMHWSLRTITWSHRRLTSSGRLVLRAPPALFDFIAARSRDSGSGDRCYGWPNDEHQTAVVSRPPRCRHAPGSWIRHLADGPIDRRPTSRRS